MGAGNGRKERGKGREEGISWPDFRHPLKSGPSSSRMSEGSFPEQRLISLRNKLLVQDLVFNVK